MGGPAFANTFTTDVQSELERKSRGVGLLRLERPSKAKVRLRTVHISDDLYRYFAWCCEHGDGFLPPYRPNYDLINIKISIHIIYNAPNILIKSVFKNIAPLLRYSAIYATDNMRP